MSGAGGGGRGSGVRRVAVLGAGPRALWAAECLADAAADITLDVFDPRPPGVGSAYAVDQPRHLRLNVTSAIVRTGLGAFDDWRRARGEGAELDPFPPRALVGAFLAHAWAAVAERLDVRHHAVAATAPRPEEGRWRVGGPDAAGELYDEVLLATGHESAWPGAWHHARPDAVPAFPVNGLTPERVPAGRPVAVRGTALTFIDAALSLTEGRGGRFTDAGYETGGAEPTIVPFSRHGRFMEPKPEPDGPLAALDLAEPRAAGAGAIASTPGSARCVAEAVRVTAQAYLRQAGGSGDVAAVLAGTDGSADPVADLRRSLAVVRGEERPHAPWAVGQAFRDLYPAIIASLSFERCPAGEWATFAALAATLERVAFGPPPVNAAKVLALVDAGVLAPPSRTEPAAEARVDAVIAPPGVVPGSLTAALVGRGIGRLASGRRGLRVGPDGGVPGWPGLAAVGRSTEDVVIGNDTLSRTLHDVVPRWAEKVSRDA
ncbi:FAD/NAD(P)-binding protein [Propioniciclava soli]|uniref:FAD/NAD(P)-binding protein n=1 Tax=Propioniciclava soli TaxID=2775081 RepID=UPI001E5545FF